MRRKRQSEKLLFGLAGFALVLFLATHFFPALGNLRHGFPGYYVAARLVMEGRWSTAVYDDAWYIAEVMEASGQRVGEVYTPNAPTMSLMLLPLAGLSLETARTAYLWVDLALIAASLGLTVAALPGLRAPALLAAGALYALHFWPLREDLRLGQVYGLLSCLIALAFWCLQRGGALPAGVALGAAAATKLLGAPLLLVLAVRREWRTLAGAALAGAGLAALTLPFAGVEGWLGFAGSLAGMSPPPGFLAGMAYQSTPGYFQHLFRPDPEWNQNPLWAQPALAAPLAWLAAGAALGLTAWRARRAPAPLVFAAGLTLSLILAPMAQEHHYVIMLLPLAVMLERVAARPVPAWEAAWLAGLALLLAAPLPYKDDWYWDGWRALLAYPRLYGGWLLWAWLVREMAPARAAPAPDALAADPAGP